MIISIDKTWELKTTQYQVKFRQTYSMNEYDKILLKLLSLHDNILNRDKFGLLLGFGMIDDRANNIYKDNAEIEIFDSLTKDLEKFSLIEQKDNKIHLSIWGEIALETGLKYTFHKGKVFVYDHIYLSYEESQEKLFPFYKFPINSDINRIRNIKSYELGYNEDIDFLLNKIKFNIK
jgi:hypothetical protein